MLRAVWLPYAWSTGVTLPDSCLISSYLSKLVRSLVLLRTRSMDFWQATFSLRGMGVDLTFFLEAILGLNLYF